METYFFGAYDSLVYTRRVQLTPSVHVANGRATGTIDICVVKWNPPAASPYCTLTTKLVH
jgi:hypothetical protein